MKFKNTNNIDESSATKLHCKQEKNKYNVDGSHCSLCMLLVGEPNQSHKQKAAAEGKFKNKERTEEVFTGNNIRLLQNYVLTSTWKNRAPMLLPLPKNLHTYMIWPPLFV